MNRGRWERFEDEQDDHDAERAQHAIDLDELNPPPPGTNVEVCGLHGNWVSEALMDECPACVAYEADMRDRSAKNIGRLLPSRPIL